MLTSVLASLSNNADIPIIIKGIKTGINTALDVKDVINAYGGGAKGAKEAFGTFMSFKNNELVDGAKGAFQQTLETGGVTSRAGKEAACTAHSHLFREGKYRHRLNGERAFSSNSLQHG